MPKEKKEPTKKRGRYEDKTPLNASFMDVIKTTVEDAKKKSAKPKQ